VRSCSYANLSQIANIADLRHRVAATVESALCQMRRAEARSGSSRESCGVRSAGRKENPSAWVAHHRARVTAVEEALAVPIAEESSSNTTGFACCTGLSAW
jgi:hypothetical protein